MPKYPTNRRSMKKGAEELPRFTAFRTFALAQPALHRRTPKVGAVCAPHVWLCAVERSVMGVAAAI
jgi:hypothetical protein